MEENINGFADITELSGSISAQSINADIAQNSYSGTVSELSYSGSANSTGSIEHNRLLGRDSENAHPITAISGLENALDSKGDGLFYDSENGMLYLTQNGNALGEGIPLVSGEYSVLTLTAADLELSCVLGGECAFCFNWSSTALGNGTAVIKKGGRSAKSLSVSQGDAAIDISDILTLGENGLSLLLTDSAGTKREIFFSVETVSLTITSTFNPLTIYGAGAEISLRCTPTGNLEKTVWLFIDEVLISETSVTTSGREITLIIPAQTHGAHTLRLTVTGMLNGVEISGNELYCAFITAQSGNALPIIASDFRAGTARQYETVRVPFLAYTEGSLTTDVGFYKNGAEIGSVTVGRSIQTAEFYCDTAGSTTLALVSGVSETSFTLTVTQTDIPANAVTADLELFLSARGRSNGEQNPDIWSFGGINAVFSGFNHTSDCWQTDSDGNTVLRVLGQARVSIPLTIFGEDFRSNGKTIEIEFATHSVADRESPIISCFAGGRGIDITAKSSILQSEQTTAEVFNAEQGRTRVSFTVSEVTSDRLLLCYINGVLSQARRYPAADNFSQTLPAYISIGSSLCGCDIYCIRVYQNDLSEHQLLANLIADTQSIEEKTLLYESADIFDAYGSPMYSKIVSLLPCLTVTGELPAYKGDKKTVSLLFESPNAVFSFSALNVQIDVQGTSSQYYPRKNYKIKLKSGVTMTQNNEHSDSYLLRENSVSANVFCLKADYMESSGSHNTGLAKYIPTLYEGKTPPQVSNGNVRTTVDGFPIVLFRKDNDNSASEYFGRYNFNFDKDAQSVFGFTDSYPACECWEVCNNTSARTLFTVSDYTTDEWKNDFEARYPDGYEDFTALKALTDWLVSVADDPVAFKSGFEAHFDLEYALVYYICTELFAMVDSRAKNLFLATWDGVLWYTIFYDMDTCFGLNNEGVNVFDSYVEYHDSIGTESVFNGSSSSLWNNFETAYAAEISEKYAELRSTGNLNITALLAVLDGEQSSAICAALYNLDMRFKYINPLVSGILGSDGNTSHPDFLYALQGRRDTHRSQWIKNRFDYIDSKYNAGDYPDDYATMRIYTPQNYVGIAPSAVFNLTTSEDCYVRVKWGSYESAHRCEKGVPFTFTPVSGSVFSDTETIIKPASKLITLGDITNKYAKSIDVSKAEKLTELIVGSDESGYYNTNLNSLSLGNNKLLKTLNVRNCPSLTQALDLSGCKEISEVYAAGSSVTAVTLPNGGCLEVLELPDTITNLTIKNQPLLTNEGLSLAGTANITTLCLENLPQIDNMALLQSCDSLSRVRITGIDLLLANTDLLDSLMTPLIGGLDENSANTQTAVLAGSVRIGGFENDSDLDIYRQYFPMLNITQSPRYSVSFLNGDGSVLETQLVWAFNSAVTPTSAPTKPNSLYYSYAFSNWINDYSCVTENMSVTPSFIQNDLYTYTRGTYDSRPGIRMVEGNDARGALVLPSVSPENVSFGLAFGLFNHGVAGATFNITSLVAPKILYAESCALWGAKALTTVVLGSPGNPVPSGGVMAQRVFDYCSALQSVTIYTENGLDTDMPGVTASNLGSYVPSNATLTFLKA